VNAFHVTFVRVGAMRSLSMRDPTPIWLYRISSARSGTINFVARASSPEAAWFGCCRRGLCGSLHDAVLAGRVKKGPSGRGSGHRILRELRKSVENGRSRWPIQWRNSLTCSDARSLQAIVGKVTIAHDDAGSILLRGGVDCSCSISS